MVDPRPPFDPNGTRTANLPTHLGPAGPVAWRKPSLRDKSAYTVQYLTAASQRKPWKTVAQATWIVLGGWLLFLAYAAAGLLLILSIIFIPFGVQALRFAV